MQAAGSMLTLDSTPSGAWVRRRVGPAVVFPDLHDEVDEIDGCELLHHIGTGGMGDVYLAAAPDRSGRRRPVALKRLRPQLVDDADMRARFCDEARLVGTLGGPGLVRPVDVSRARSRHYYTMEFIDGMTLAELLKVAAQAGARLPLEVALQIARGLADALARFHDRDDALVHCDVSPSNVLLTPTGHVRLVDYGLCRGSHQTVSSLHHGRVLGTVSYMSPEQCNAEEIDARSDVFSVGILLYEMVTMTRLFRGSDVDEIGEQIMRCRFPRPRELRGEIQIELDDLVMRALRPNARVRFQSAALLRRAIDGFVQRAGLHGSPRLVSSFMRSLA
jgi:eukaryotic-like serine/threonine-protein kinase